MARRLSPWREPSVREQLANAMVTFVGSGPCDADSSNTADADASTDKQPAKSPLGMSFERGEVT